ncbi:MAG: hypothetical protein ACI8X3_002376 [Saprospiraceae bacterium]|jgi:hypothetical protein
MFKPLLTYTFLLLFVTTSFGQNVNMDQSVDLNYRNVRLEDALLGISETYNIHFSYSKHYIPIDQRVNIKVAQQPLSFALDELFEETEVVYASIGDQIVLKKGKNTGRINQQEDLYSPQFGVIQPPIRAIDQYGSKEPILTASTHPYEEVEELPILERYNYGLPGVFSERQEEEIDTEKYYVLAPEPVTDLSSATAQVSLVPFIGTNREEAKEKTNNLSLNLLGGENGGVDGVEIGGLFNKVERDVKGVQIAGFFNSVGGDVGPSKLIDGKEKKTFGVQIAGLVNTADNVHAVQVGGLWNANKGSFKGVQFGGLGNRNGGDAEGVQIGGLFNINGGNGGVQVAGVTNIARDIYGTQVSGLFNKAKNVYGVQFALINVCDTVSGASIGFLNFVKKGYNQFEMGGSETMRAQFSIRFGSRRFYNIFQFGAKFKGLNAYGIGYGIGTTINHRQSKRWQWNTELLASHIIENNEWFNNLNLLAELRLTAEYKMCRWASFYIGPTVNLMISDLLDAETGAINATGSKIPAYVLFDNKNSDTNTIDLKGWIGVRAGLRFGRN